MQPQHSGPQHYANLPGELWHLVYQYLPGSSLLQGALVSKTLSLSLYCQSQIWARIEADDWVFEGMHQGLIRNSALVRRITCSAKSQLGPLSGSECRSITHLDVEKIRFLNSVLLEGMLDHNQASLQSLRLRLDRTILQMVAGKIAGMGELKELYLQHWEGIHQEALETILEACPQVEVLSLGHNSLYPFALENLKQESDQESHSPKAPFRIRSLILDSAVIFKEELLLNLATRCPDLENLSMQGCFGIRLTKELIADLARLCPKLNRINLTNMSTTPTFFTALFQALPGLKEIKMTGSTLTDEDVLVMIQSCHSTLEILDIGFCNSLSSSSVLTVMTGCPQLVHFDARGVDFNPRDMEPTDQWVCTHHLQSIYLEVLLPKRSHYGPGEPHRIRTRVYEQLARLTELRSLQLGAGSKDRGVNILEMSLLTGLSSLSTLVKLERLEIKRLNHAVRAAEATWMLDHWPRLKALGILLDSNADMDLVHVVHKKNRNIIVW